MRKNDLDFAHLLKLPQFGKEVGVRHTGPKRGVSPFLCGVISILSPKAFGMVNGDGYHLDWRQVYTGGGV